MALFTDIFDVANLDDHILGHLEFILNSPSYGDVFKPYLVRMRDSLAVKLLDPSRERKDQYPDDFIRGGIITIDGLVSFFERLIEETTIERLARSQRPLSGNEQYEFLRSEGRIRPITGIESERYSAEILPEEDY